MSGLQQRLEKAEQALAAASKQVVQCKSFLDVEPVSVLLIRSKASNGNTKAGGPD
jgi:hypothetical protein